MSSIPLGSEADRTASVIFSRGFRACWPPVRGCYAWGLDAFSRKAGGSDRSLTIRQLISFGFGRHAIVTGEW